MSALSPQQINQSYQGLLKLSDSTTGITSTLQAVEDGLGNDTGLNIATNRLEGGNLFNLYRPSTIPQYFGNGITAVSQNNPGAIGNTLIAGLFYDNGIHSYSAITVNVTNLEASSSIEVAFYNTQYLDTYGYAPYQKLVTEVSIDTTSTGIKTISFPTPLSFSGTGPGVYYVVFKYNSTGSATQRLSGNPNTNVPSAMNWMIISNLGIVFNTAATSAQNAFRVNSTSGLVAVVNYNTASFPTTWTSTELNTITSVASSLPGFLLNTIR